MAIRYLKDGYADLREGYVFDNRYWIFLLIQLHLSSNYFRCFFFTRSCDLEKALQILSVENVSWLEKALWAPAIIYANEKYYLYFSANDVHEGEIGGIGVAVADSQKGRLRMLWVSH
mgnify:CR=1 FL=1